MTIGALFSLRVEMFKRIPKRVISLAGGGAAQSVLNAALALLLTRWLPIHDRGQMVTIIAFATIVALLSGICVSTAFRLRAAALTEVAPTYFISCLVLPGIAGLTSGVGAYVYVVSTDSSYWLVAGGAAAGFALLLQSMCWDAWYAYGKYHRGSLWAAATSAIAVVSCLAVSPARPSAGQYLIVQMGSISLGTLFSFVLLIYSIEGFRGRWSWAAFRELAGTGRTVLGWNFGMVIMSRSDRIVLALLVAPAAAAIYGLAVTYAEAIRVLSNSVAQLLVNRDHSAQDGFASKWSPLVIASAVIAIGLLGLPVFGFLVNIAYVTEYQSSIWLAGALLVAEFGMSLFLLSSRWLQGGGQLMLTRRIAVITAAAAVPSFALGGAVWGLGGVVGAVIMAYLALGLLAFAFVLRQGANGPSELILESGDGNG